MAKQARLTVPDIGDFDAVDVIEVLIAPGDRIEREQSLITLESDKATMEVPAEQAGIVREVAVNVGDQLSEGDLIAVLEVEEEDKDSAAASEPEPRSEPDTAERPASTAQQERPASPAATAGEDEWDLVVLGAGPGGYTAAFRAADLGLKVALVERYAQLGGVCLNVGCIPSKALLHAAKVIDDVSAMREHGLDFGAPHIDRERLAAWKDGVVRRLTQGLSGLARQRKVEVVTGTARFADAHRLRVDTAEGDRELRFRHAIIAAGSRPVAPPGFDLEHPRVMDSTGALELRDLPQRLLVVGGGIIGLEMASVYSALGSQVTVVELSDRLIPGPDQDMVKPLLKRIEKSYENIYLQTKVTRLEPDDDGVDVRFEGEDAPERDRFDRVLVAVGRRPNSDLIGIDAAGLEADAHGFISVDAQQRTAVNHIFAIGDIVGNPMLAHKATHEGKVAAEVTAGQKRAFDARVIPSVAYTDPEIAWVGVTETEARAQGIDYDKTVFPWAANGRSLGMGRDEGVTKLLFDRKHGRIIGGAITGTNAGDLISEVALAIEMGADAEDIALTIHPHPTLSETVAMAAEAAAGTLTDLYMPQRNK